VRFGENKNMTHFERHLETFFIFSLFLEATTPPPMQHTKPPPRRTLRDTEQSWFHKEWGQRSQQVEEIPGIGECVGAHQITKSQRGCKSRENVGVRGARHQVRGVGWHFVERAII